MTMKYALYPNNLTPDPNDFTAKVVDAPTRTLDDLLDEMAHPGSGLTEGEVRMVVSALERCVQKAIQRGENVNLGFLRSSITIQGVFHHKNEAFDSSKHTLVLNWQASNGLQKQLELISLEKVASSLKRPILSSFHDLKSDSTNAQATPGRIGVLAGVGLKVDTDDPEQGVYFINGQNQEAKVALFSKNVASELHFEIPDGLADGSYRLEVRNRYKGSQTLRVGSLEQFLNVSSVGTPVL